MNPMMRGAQRVDLSHVVNSRIMPQTSWFQTDDVMLQTESVSS